MGGVPQGLPAVKHKVPDPAERKADEIVPPEMPRPAGLRRNNFMRRSQPNLPSFFHRFSVLSATSKCMASSV
jgi:hypothetical protein